MSWPCSGSKNRSRFGGGSSNMNSSRSNCCDSSNREVLEVVLVVVVLPRVVRVGPADTAEPREGLSK